MKIFRLHLEFLLLILLPVLCGACSHEKDYRDMSIKIGKLDEFMLDGKFEEWEKLDFHKLYTDPLGNYTDRNDLSAKFKIAWEENHILLYFEIFDDKSVSDTIFPWNGDAVELFLSDKKGSENSVQYSIVTGQEGEDEGIVRISDRRKLKNNSWKAPSLRNAVSHQDSITRIEIELDYDIFGQEEDPDYLAFQIYVDDKDEKNERKQYTWYPVGHSYLNTFSYYKIQLKEKGDDPVNATSRLVITDNEKLMLYVFGATRGDKIKLKNENTIITHFSATSSLPGFPDSLELTNFNLDFERDTLQFYLNGKHFSTNDLFFAPRIYVDKNPPRFEREIRLFKAQDRLNMPEPGGVLFIGSSSIRLWSNVHNDFPELNIIHRGFGGSISSDVLDYFEDIVMPYNPKSIVYYEGDNDIPHGLSRQEIIGNMTDFIQRVHENRPDTKIYLISPKPSITRRPLWPKYEELHEAMELMADEIDWVYFVNVASQMFDEKGNLLEDLFIEDGLHMNEEGYAIWRELLREKMNLTEGE